MKTVELKRINDQRIFENDLIFRKSEKFAFAGLYYEYSLKHKTLMRMIELSKNKIDKKVIKIEN